MAGHAISSLSSRIRRFIPAGFIEPCLPSPADKPPSGAASLQQLIAAARLPNSGIFEIAVNASLAFIEGAKPRDEIECALVIQMACTHSAAWRCQRLPVS